MCWRGSTGIQLVLQVPQGRSAEIKATYKGTYKTPRELTVGRLNRARSCARYRKAEGGGLEWGGS